MNLFILHCGFYDATDAVALFENHANFYIVAEDFVDAKAQMKAHPTFRSKRMHIDGIQKVLAINGYRIELRKDEGLDGKTVLENLKYGSRSPLLIET
jgi:hypothetical protein